MRTIVRRANTADATSIALLGRVTFGETFGYLFRKHPDDLRRYLDATFGVQKIEASLGKSGNAYWMAESDRLPVGYAKLKHPSRLPGDERQAACQLQKIYVLAEMIGLGVGRALLESTVSQAAALAPVLWLDVLKENGRAIAFYTRLGFASAGDDTYTIGTQQFRFHLMARRFA